ncbi:asparaginase [Salinirarus marinus]|uniref:asparaginase n=1 Tax=Salinirarus marinus TaxID=3068310 RepID=UPI003C6C7B3C
MTVVVVSTGGTIASTEDAGGDAEPELTGADLVAAVPGLRDVADVGTREFATVPSPHFTVDRMYGLVETLRELDADPDVEGVVVTQGTDVLEETAYFADLCYGGETPVVFTGAMRNPSLAGADGPANLLASVRVAASDPDVAGAFVVFADRVHAAREATKTHSMAVDTFRSPEFGPLAFVDEDRVTWRRRPENPDPTLDPERENLTNDVVAATATADVPAAHLDPARDAEALCLAATGAGHVPPTILPALESVREAGTPVVVTTRCPEGRLARHTYAFEGSEATLRELGVHYSDVNLQKTRIRAVAALAAGRLDDAFERP